jgi:hypothetical protein
MIVSPQATDKNDRDRKKFLTLSTGSGKVQTTSTATK